MASHARVRVILAALVFAFACSAGTGAESAPRVRPLDARMAAMLERGKRASPTLAALAEALERTDVIVHIGEQRDRFPRAQGETRFVTLAGGFRYLRIRIAPTVTGDAAVALLGHELYHAWEIAEARWVDNRAAVETLYEQIGHTHRADGLVRADSPAAQRTGRRVRDELVAFGSGD